MTKIVPEDLVEVARVYNAAYDIGQGHRAVQIVAQRFGCDRSTAHRHVEKARDAGLLVIFPEGHDPMRVRPLSKGTSWVACSTCRTPWPCDVVKALTS